MVVTTTVTSLCAWAFVVGVYVNGCVEVGGAFYEARVRKVALLSSRLIHNRNTGEHPEGDLCPQVTMVTAFSTSRAAVYIW